MYSAKTAKKNMVKGEIKASKKELEEIFNYIDYFSKKGESRVSFKRFKPFTSMTVSKLRKNGFKLKIEVNPGRNFIYHIFW